MKTIRKSIGICIFFMALPLIFIAMIMAELAKAIGGKP